MADIVLQRLYQVYYIWNSRHCIEPLAGQPMSKCGVSNMGLCRCDGDKLVQFLGPKLDFLV